MDVSTLHVGDRVRLVRPIGNLPAGAHGIVETVFAGADLYDIDFDTPFGLQLVLGTELEQIVQALEHGGVAVPSPAA